MVCKCPFDISVICEVLGLPYNKFYRWFKSCLTDFKTEAGQIKLHKHDFNVPSRNGHKTILVPVFRPEHFGSHMAIDEKHIHGVFYTVLTNAKTGKVALLCSTIRANELKTCLDKFDPMLLDGVQFVTLDLSPTFQLVVNQNFKNAIQIADKFHVIKNGIEHLQAIRTRLKQQALKHQREQQTLHDKNYKEAKNKDLIGPKMKISKAYHPQRLTNGETIPELLARSRYLMLKSPDKWSEYQINRAKLLFQLFPQLELAMKQINEFRNWYKKKPKEFEPFENERRLGNWMNQLENSTLSEMKNFRHLVNNHEDRIMNYHRCGNKTNAIAESVNAKIKNAIRQNKGARDLDFFHFRIAMIL